MRFRRWTEDRRLILWLSRYIAVQLYWLSRCTGCSHRPWDASLTASSGGLGITGLQPRPSCRGARGRLAE